MTLSARTNRLSIHETVYPVVVVLTRAKKHMKSSYQKFAVDILLAKMRRATAAVVSTVIVTVIPITNGWRFGISTAGFGSMVVGRSGNS